MSTSFFADDLLAQLSDWPATRRYWIAYSGGVDSHALLHAMCALAGEISGSLQAIHVDHGIHPSSAAWSGHCRKVCEGLGVPLSIVSIDARPRAGMSPESQARRLRYLALRERISEQEMLLTAHHQDDQAETMLLQLCRGAGPAGLAAMPALRRFGQGWHGRPLLRFSRQTILAYAGRHALTWIDDDSNLDTRFDRNFLRREIMPPLRRRWPALPAVLSRVASHQAEAAGLLHALAMEDLKGSRAEEWDALDLRALRQIPEARQSNILRYWLKERGFPLPDAEKLRRIHAEVINARPDANPCLSWPGVEIRRYRDDLFASAPLAPHDPSRVVAWRLEERCVLDGGVLTARRGAGNGIRCSACQDGNVDVRFRQGGERLRPAGSPHRRELKVLFQERGIPPWLRDRIPLLYIGNRLAAAANLWIEWAFAAAPGEDAWQIAWTGLSLPPPHKLGRTAWGKEG